MKIPRSLFALACALALLLPFLLCSCSALAPQTQERAQPSTYVLVSPVANYLPGATGSPSSTEASQWADTQEGTTQEGTADTDAPSEVTVPVPGLSAAPALRGVDAAPHNRTDLRTRSRGNGAPSDSVPIRPPTPHAETACLE